ncbi:hypothetical protein D3C72_1763070 [compost metagenome]
MSARCGRLASRAGRACNDARRHYPVRGLYRPDAAGRADWRVAGAGRAGCHRLVQPRHPDVRPAGRAAELLRWPGQIPAAGDSDVRAGGVDFRPLRRGGAAGDLRDCRGGAWPGHAAAGGDSRGDVPRRHLGLGPGQRGGRGWRDDRGDVARGLSAGVQRVRGRRGGGYRHPDPAIGRLHYL